MDEYNTFMAEKDEMNNLIATINKEVKDIKKSLRFRKSMKGKLD